MDQKNQVRRVMRRTLPARNMQQIRMLTKPIRNDDLINRTKRVGRVLVEVVLLVHAMVVEGGLLAEAESE